MDYSIYIRPLRIEDAAVSCQWRNNPKIWRFTGSKPDQHITVEMETKWLEKKLFLASEKRFAICLKANNRYIGNVNLTDIDNKEAQYHIFIGDMEYWGGKRAYQATVLVFDYGFQELNLETIWMEVRVNNVAAITICKNMGFVETGVNNDFAKFILDRQMYNRKEHLKWDEQS